MDKMKVGRALSHRAPAVSLGVRLAAFAVSVATPMAHAQLPGWSTQLPVTITETSGTTLANYQVRLVLDTAALISGGQMNADASDLRFGSDEGGSSLLDYWIESGVNTATTVIWIKVPTLPASAVTGIYLFTGNPAAPAVSTLNVFGYTDETTNSATNQVSGGSVGGVTNSQRGIRFSPNEDILLIQFGKNEPNGTTRYVTLFDNASQAILAQMQVSGPAAQYTYANLPQPIWLTQGTQYVLELYQDSTDGYYFGPSTTQINPRLTYLDMRYCNSCTQNTFPTNFLNAIHYGYPDFEFMTREHASSEPLAAQVDGPTTTSLSSPGSVTIGQSVTFTASVAGVFDPTGSVTFSDGGNVIQGCDDVALDSGSPPVASCTATLTTGTHEIIAAYGGDDDDAPSVSDEFAQVVDPMVSTTALGTACQTTFVENQPFTMAATVSGYAPLSGVVTFNDAANVLGIIPLTAGGATFTVSTFEVADGIPAETHVLTAAYGGDTQNTSSASPMLTVNVLNVDEAIFRNGFDSTVASCPVN